MRKLWFRFVILPWRRRQQAIDLKILWPSMRDISLDDLVKARRAFRMHMEMDSAYDHMSNAEREEYVRKLPAH